MICKQCGAQIDDNSTECRFCGAVYEENIKAENKIVLEECDENSEISEHNIVETTEGDKKAKSETVNDVEEILDENELKRRRQIEKIKVEKQNQLEEIEKRRATKRKKQKRNRVLACVIIVLVAAGIGGGSYYLWNERQNGPDIIIATQSPVDDSTIPSTFPIGSVTPEITPDVQKSDDLSQNNSALNLGNQSADSSSKDSQEGSLKINSTENGSSNNQQSSDRNVSTGNNWRVTNRNNLNDSSSNDGTTNKSISNSSSSNNNISSSDIKLSAPIFGGTEYSSEGGYSNGKFTAALITGVEVITNGDRSYMVFKYNGVTYYANISANTTTTFIQGRPMTINAFKTSEVFNGSDVYEITSIINYNANYIFPNSGFIKLTESNLKDKSTQELLLGRNEIYARHGRKFQNNIIREYFESCSWYKIKDSYNYEDEASNLNSIEIYNVSFIKSYEDKLNK